MEEKKNIMINEISKAACLGENFTDHYKEELNILLKEKKYRIAFLSFLNKYRSSGLFCISENCFNIIGDIMNRILDEVTQNEDYESARYCIILSQTFHFIKGDIKIFLQQKIQKHKSLKQTTFWENFIACK